MNSKVFSADIEKYNANNRGTNTTDCVKRALSFAFDVPYIQISKELNAAMKAKHFESYKVPIIFEDVIEMHGGSKPKKLPDPEMTLEQFADTYDKGTYLVSTGDKPNTRNHIVCVLDGVVYDTWDSRKAYVHSYYDVNHIHRVITSIKDEMPELSEQAVKLVEEEGNKLVKKYGWDRATWYVDDDVHIEGYSMRVSVTLRVQWPDGSSRYFDDEIVFVVTPTTSLEDARKIVKNTAKVRTYDRFYAVNVKLKEAKEEIENRKQLEQEGKKTRNEYYYYGIEDRLYKSLPGWAKGRLKYLSYQQPNQFSDSCEVDIYPLPGRSIDPQYLGTGGVIEFRGYNSTDVKDMLNRYYKNDEVPYRDYSPYEEY